nr:MAG TPA: hypothetical protein [Caudoviricetes sp.]DAU69091.1 MAG TPA: hypothetical protein [Caudoviricetes sp.]
MSLAWEYAWLGTSIAERSNISPPVRFGVTTGLSR